ncbi:dihydrodipicolinate synthase family protein [Streptomyces sp. NPDC008150]|uniref:dihydrodipicolinate synthase family protein n=1 Tax=Streptomyces sp. NPDC008150 TaxID=3364816 RepID=UPI0036E9E166
MTHDVPQATQTARTAQTAELLPGCHVMGLTPFTRRGDLDEGALREHTRRLADENLGFWPASPATGEGAQMSDAEIFRTLEIVVEEAAGRVPVIASGLEFPTAALNIAYMKEARQRGADAVQLYPPTLGHSSVPSPEMLERFYDEVLSSADTPVVLSSNQMTGFEVPAAVLDRPIAEHPQVAGVFKNHPDQQNIADFVTRFAPRTTVLTMLQRLLFAAPAGAKGVLDNLQNVAPRLSRTFYDALLRGDLAATGDAYRTLTALWGEITGFSAARSAPRVVVYKAMLRILGLPGGHPRRPYVDLGDQALRELARIIDAVGLREAEGLV